MVNMVKSFPLGIFQLIFITNMPLKSTYLKYGEYKKEYKGVGLMFLMWDMELFALCVATVMLMMKIRDCHGIGVGQDLI